MQIFLKWLLTSLFILILPYLIKGVTVTNFITAILTALILGILNTIIKPILMFLTLPINILTLGLFTLIINGFMVFIATKIIPGFEIVNFWYAILFAIMLSIFNWLIK
ncbi:MAG TPA: phage holin family protein [bacterium]|nr:phage holin family protein [bacterium]